MQKILLVLVGIILFDCSERKQLVLEKQGDMSGHSEETTIREELKSFAQPAQLFKIDLQKTNTIDTKNGVKIIIPANVFEMEAGKIEGEIDIEIMEVFDKSEMVLSGVTTTSNNQLLESFGMFHITAKNNGKELKIKPNSSIKTVFPDKNNSGNAELFYGQKIGEVIDWQTMYDSLVICDTIIPDKSGVYQIKRNKYKYLTGVKSLIFDTIFYTRYYDSTSIFEDVWSSISFEFELQKLGWINCDRFVNETNVLDLQFKIKEINKPFGYLVFEEINSVMPINFNQKMEIRIPNLPKDYHVHLIVIDQINDEEMVWCKKSFKIGTENNFVIETQKISKDDLKNELRKLDKGV